MTTWNLVASTLAFVEAVPEVGLWVEALARGDERANVLFETDGAEGEEGEGGALLSYSLAASESDLLS